MEATHPFVIPRDRPHLQPFTRPQRLLEGCVLALLQIRGDYWYDFSGKQNHGTLTNAIFSAKGRGGVGLSFNGTNARVEIADAATIDFVDQFTYSGWIYPTQSGSEMALLNKGTGGAPGDFSYYALWRVFDDIKFHISDGTNIDAVTTSKIPLNTWSNIVLVLTTTHLRAYVNGKADGVTARTRNPVANNKKLYIGDSGDGARYFMGIMDEVQVYDRALSVDEIRYLYDIGRVR